MRDSVTMDFNALDLLASTAVLQTRDSENSGSPGANHQDDDKGDGTSEPSAETDEEAVREQSGDKSEGDTGDTMGFTKQVGNGSIPPETLCILPKDSVTSDTLQSTEEEQTCKSEENATDSVENELYDIKHKTDSSDTDSCLEDNDAAQAGESTSELGGSTSSNIGDKMGKSKTIMRSLLTGQTVRSESDRMEDVNIICCDVKVNCEEADQDSVSVEGNDQTPIESDLCGSANKKPLSLSEKTSCENAGDGQPDSMDTSFNTCDQPTDMSENKLEKSGSLQDSVLDSPEDPTDNSSASNSDSENLHFGMISDHCYATVPGKTVNPSYSYLEKFEGDESDSGIDGNSSSEEAEHRTRSLSLDSNCLHCSFPELPGRSSRLLSQGSEFDRSPIGSSTCHLGMSVLSPTLSSSDSQCSDYHHSGNNLVENASIQKYDSDSPYEEKKYKTVDFDVDSSVAGTSDKSDSSGHELAKVGKFRIGKFASFTNIDDTDTDKMYTRDSFNLGYGVSPASSVGMPASPGIPSLLQSPCGDWDRSDAGSEALDDNMDSIPPTPEEPKELSLILQSNKTPGINSLCLTVNHDHDYCFRGGSLPASPVAFERKSTKTEKRKYMTAARSRGTNLYLKEPKTKNVKLKNKKLLSDTIEKVKNSLASSPTVAIDCNFKKPEQPANSLFDKLNASGRPKRKLEKEEEPEIELDSGSKLKITGKFQNDFVYFLTKTSRNRRRASVETAVVTTDSGKVLQPAKPIDIIVPHLTDEDLEVLQTKGRAGLARLEKFSSNPQLLDRFSATLQTQNKMLPAADSGVTKVTDKSNGISQQVVSENFDDDKIINTILSMENDNLGSPVAREPPSVNTDMDFYNCGGETINLMGENMTLTPDQVDLLLNAVKDVSTPEEFIENPGKMDLSSQPVPIGSCEHSVFSEADQSCDSCSTVILDSTQSDSSIPDQEWTDKKEAAAENKVDTEDTESTYSSSDIGHSSVSDVKEDSQESFELKDGEMDTGVGGGVTDTPALTPTSMANGICDTPTSLANGICDKNLALDNDLNSLALGTSKPDKNLLDTELNGFSNSLGNTLPDLSLPLEKSFELLGSDLFPEANVEAPPPPPQTVTSSQEESVSDYNNTPWVVTVTIYWNDLPAIMINNRPFLRLVDIHKQILPAKDTGILKKRCQLLSIHVMNCSEMQRYFLVQYGRGYNSKSTLIVSKQDACQLVGYYAQPPPRVSRVEDQSAGHELSPFSEHMALMQPSLPSPPPRMSRKKRSGSRAASRNTSPDRKENSKTNTSSAPPSPKVPKPQPLPIPTEVTKRLRHKKINFLEMLKGDPVVEKAETPVEDPVVPEKKPVSPQPLPKKKVDANKKSNVRSKKKEEEVTETPTETNNDSVMEESEILTEKTTDIEPQITSALPDEEGENKSKRRKSINNKNSPTNGKKSASQKLGPLRVSVKGLLHFPKPAKKSATVKNDKILEVVHTAQEIKEGQLPISQNGLLQLELYKKKSSLCVRCVDCNKLLSVQSFLSHQHYPEEDKTLTTVMEAQTLSPKSDDMSRIMKGVWEEFQQRREKFEGSRFEKPTKSVVVLKNNVESVSKIMKNGEFILDTSTTVVLDVEDHLSSAPSGDTSVNSDVTEHDLSLDNSTEEKIPEENVCKSSSHTTASVCDLGNKSAKNSVAGPPPESVSESNCHQHLSNNNKMEAHPVVPEELNSSFPDLNNAADALDKSGVRSSSRKRKSRQYFSFEDYSFSNKKSRVDDVEWKGDNTSTTSGV